MNRRTTVMGWLGFPCRQCTGGREGCVEFVVVVAPQRATLPQALRRVVGR